MARSAFAKLRRSPATIWWLRLGAAALAVIAVTLAVAGWSVSNASSPLAGSAAPREVPSVIDGHFVQTEFGRQLFMQNCSSCHGTDASGMPRQGANLRDSVFVSRRDDRQLMSFLRVGRRPGERDSVLGLTMPPRGGNARLEDDELADIIAYLRLVQKQRPARQFSSADLPGSARGALQ
jgi:cytochrome c5